MKKRVVGGARPGAAAVFVDRRRRDSSGLRSAEIVTRFAKWLPALDLAVVNWVYHSERPIVELAIARRERVWALRRHLQRLVRRVLSIEYQHIANKLERAIDPPPWPPRAADCRNESRLNLAIGRAVFVDGLSMRRAAETSGLSFHVVRRHCDAILVEISAG